MTLSRPGWIALVLSFWPLSARAHSPIAGVEGFYTGLFHPLSTPSQLLLMLGLGLLIGCVPPARALRPLGVFPAAMLLGMAASGVFAQIDMAMFAIAFLACALAALAPGRLFATTIALAALGGLFIGVASLADPGPLRDRIITTLGAFIGANVLLLYVSGFSGFLQERYPRNWVPIAFRIIAAWIGAVCLLMLALPFAAGGAPP